MDLKDPGSKQQKSYSIEVLGIMSDRENQMALTCRRLLYMVAELHRMGYEQARISPGVAPSGLFWRLSVTAASNTMPDNGALMINFDGDAHYSSGAGAEFFGWKDAENDSPAELAIKFIERFPDIAKEANGRDPEYVRWYREMLEMTEPDGLMYAYADWPRSEDRLDIFSGSKRVEIPLPPPFRAERKS